ncbi:hydroxymethylbilane synthase [Rubripirellula reticaptiva]|uniref:Porphobilinogen deaminase n=1 Tax=Rubripirellula reticaptiva TaxID=2528013 RepID=A0A5C6EFA6_9BACT|nr:hydroxymethylbilane synthase [Rubripirellula reticaptiva]TWU47682.1 Porphobilinogen deaminase [Rubripirellula reticaptiva]
MLRIATRQSPLALWQAEHVAALLASAGIQTVLVPMVSSGDTDMRPIDGTRQVGLFTKRIQQALLEDEGDIAVHSLKDLPTEVNELLTLAAVPVRETVTDCLVSKSGVKFSDLPNGAKIGTGSRRRAAQILSRRPDLNVEGIRGNVQTRLSKLDEGFDAIVLADAGLVRLEMADLPRYHFTFDEMLPAPGQGALGIEVRANDKQALEAAATMDDMATRAAVTAERTLLSSLHGGCLAPIAAYAVVDGDVLRMSAVALSPDGRKRIDETDEIEFANDLSAAVELANRISQRMVDAGAIEMVRG